MSDKQLVLDALQQMPDSVSLEEIQDELELLAAIQRGHAEADAGNVIDHETVMKMSEEWISKSSGPRQA